MSIFGRRGRVYGDRRSQRLRGKNRCLNIIAGLLPYEEGNVFIDGQTCGRSRYRRAVVFQHSSLLPWRTLRAMSVRY